MLPFWEPVTLVYILWFVINLNKHKKPLLQSRLYFYCTEKSDLIKKNNVHRQRLQVKGDFLTLKASGKYSFQVFLYIFKLI